MKTTVIFLLFICCFICKVKGQETENHLVRVKIDSSFKIDCYMVFKGLLIDDNKKITILSALDIKSIECKNLTDSILIKNGNTYDFIAKEVTRIKFAPGKYDILNLRGYIVEGRDVLEPGRTSLFSG